MMDNAKDKMSDQTNLLLSDFKIKDRVELHPATDAWMMGDRYGTVEKIGRFYLHVKMDRSGKVRKVSPENINGKV
jgi:hypothetical protein